MDKLITVQTDGGDKSYFVRRQQLISSRHLCWRRILGNNM